MSIWAEPEALLPGLMPAAFRGVAFHVPNARHEVGRRIIKTYFPGIDDAAFEDLGRFDGFIDLRGLIVGDDYIARAEALRAAFQGAGPGTLFHPWLGELTAVVSQPAVISFDARELRVARIDASLERVGPPPRAPASTLAAVIEAAAGVGGAARRLIAGLGAAA